MKAHGATSLADLRKVNASDLNWPLTQFPLNVSFPGYYVDGVVLPALPEAMLRRHPTQPPLVINAERILMGSTSMDGIACYGSTAVVPTDNYKSTYDLRMRAYWGVERFNGFKPGGKRVLQQYPMRRFANVSAHGFVRADADYTVVCPVMRLARGFLRTSTNATRGEAAARGAAAAAAAGGGGGGSGSGDVGGGGGGGGGSGSGGGGDGGDRAVVTSPPPMIWHFTFTKGPTACDEARLTGVTPLNATGWASHAADVVFTFDTGGGSTCHFDAADELLSQQVMHFWASFAASGEPLKGQWPEFRGSSEVDWSGRVNTGTGNYTISNATSSTNTMQLGAEVLLLHDYRAADCAFWDHLQPLAPAAPN
jgi:hypothetical protein